MKPLTSRHFHLSYSCSEGPLWRTAPEQRPQPNRLPRRTPSSYRLCVPKRRASSFILSLESLLSRCKRGPRMTYSRLNGKGMEKNRSPDTFHSGRDLSETEVRELSEYWSSRTFIFTGVRADITLLHESYILGGFSEGKVQSKIAPNIRSSPTKM